MCYDINYLINLYEINNTKNIIALSKISYNIIDTMDYFMLMQLHTHNNGMMFATPNNKFLKAFIEYIIITSKNTRYTSAYLKIQKLTGPVALSKFIKNYKAFSTDNILYELKQTIFDACAGGSCAITDNTICAHVYEGTWKSTNIIYLNILLIIFIIFAIIMIYLLLIHIKYLKI
jgi:mannosyltransferase OCH1-like enzyme